MNLNSFIRTIPNFPTAGILFRDITPLLKNSAAFDYVIRAFAENIAAQKPEVIVGIESRGFIFGAALAQFLHLPFVPVRKPGKLPAETCSVKYSLEYGHGQLEIHRDALSARQKIVIVDDLLATGGTARAANELVTMLAAETIHFLFLIELKSLGGRNLIENKPATTLLSYD